MQTPWPEQVSPRQGPSWAAPTGKSESAAPKAAAPSATLARSPIPRLGRATGPDDLEILADGLARTVLRSGA